MAELTIQNIADGLVQFAPTYAAIDVFANDVSEIVRWNTTGFPPAEWVPLDSAGTRFLVPVGGRFHLLEIFGSLGVVRLSVDTPPTPNTRTDIAAGATLGGAAGAAIASASSRKGDAWAAGLVLGLLVGAAVGGAIEASANAKPPRRVFTLRFDPTTYQWRAYDGGLVPWMKSNLLPAA